MIVFACKGCSHSFRTAGVEAEDLLDLALAAEGFDPIAVCGPPGCPAGLTVAPDAAATIRASYR